MKLSLLIQTLLTTSSFTNSLFIGEDALESVFKIDEVDAMHSNLQDYVKEKVFQAGQQKQESISLLEAVWSELNDKVGPGKLLHEIEEFEANHSPERSSFEAKAKVETKEASNEKEFKVLTDDKFSSYALRVKKNHPEKLGLDTVDQYTGYFDIGNKDKHLFYWFFESRNDPVNDPVILWLNGGPGCSSSIGLFFELGPSSIDATIKPVYNPFSWNSNASVIFLDSPVNVGYSYGDDTVTSTAAAAEDIYVFLELFFQQFPQFVNLPFHIASESYGGHYAPAVASAIINRADRSFDLTSVMIGNGITDSLIQYGYYEPMACGRGGYEPIIDEEGCKSMNSTYAKCEVLLELCYEFQNAFTCVPASLYCETILDPLKKFEVDVYDIRRRCNASSCYYQHGYIEEYLNQDFVKEAVGASPEKKYNTCEDSVMIQFLSSGDLAKPFQQYVTELLERDIPVLIYAGDKDFICNWLGNKAWVEALSYKNHDMFQNQPMVPWITPDGFKAGEVKNFDKFTFLRVYDAGHMVPFNQPQNSLDLVNTWLSGDYSFGTTR